ncbi:MAG: hypothetical protein IID48_19675 [Proteobacteria bacterium]|nr:hypothetical protein [Pseudomonadota bacterium]
MRTSYPGLILVAAGLLKAQRGEPVGAHRLLTKALQKLHGVAPVGSPVATGAFIENAKSALALVDRLGPEGIGRFDHYFPLRGRGEDGPGLRITR